MFCLNQNAEIGISLAGVELGEHLDSFLTSDVAVVNENDVEWNTSLTDDNEGLLFYKLNGGGGQLYLNNSCLVLSFNEDNILVSIEANSAYQGYIYNNIKVGDSLGKVSHRLYLDDTNDVHYLCDESENIIDGIYFIAEGERVEDDPEQVINGVCIYNWK